MRILKSFKTSLFIVYLCLSSIAFADPVGTITFKSGDATITRADNSSVAAEKNTALNAGDTVETREGRLQLALMDGGKVSLQPNTIYKINKYAFSGKEDGSEYAFTELIKGGLRTISGLVGHKNRDRYQLKTAVATIGIRGTEFTVNFINNQLLMTTNHGSVDVCNQGGCLNAVTGQTISVAGLGAPPKPSDKPATAAAAAPVKVALTIPESAKTVFAVNDSVDQNGLPDVIAKAIETGAVIVPGNGNGNGNGTGTGTGTGQEMLYLHTETTNGGHENGLIAGTANNNGNGRVQYFQDANSSNSYTFSDALGGDHKDSYVRMGSTLAVKTDGNISENLSNFQGIVGTLTSTSNLMNLASLANPAVSYSVLASTAPAIISTSGSPYNATAGTANLVNGNMTVNFATLVYAYSLNNIQAGLNTFAINGAGSLISGENKFAGYATVTETSGLITNILTCTLSCIGHLANGNVVQGAFFGPNAERVGMQYGFTSNAGEVFGSVVLGR